VVIYMPDHGEECFNPPMLFHRRLHPTRIDRRLAREEFEIPFWIWCSNKNRELHPEIYNAVRAARQRPFMTDNLPHILLSLAGIYTKDYRSDYDLLSPLYNSKRPRMLKNQVNYNDLQ
jgi:heptose-I-phosphate ethanolaminephosphotransferase